MCTIEFLIVRKNQVFVKATRIIDYGIAEHLCILFEVLECHYCSVVRLYYLGIPTEKNKNREVGQIVEPCNIPILKDETVINEIVENFMLLVALIFSTINF